MARFRRAFSLIELMIVVAIIGIASAIATPSISAATSRRNADQAFQQVMAFVVAARDEARMQRRCVELTRPAASELQMQRYLVNDDGTCSVTTDGSAKLKDFNATYISIPAATAVTFDPNGGMVVPTTDVHQIAVTVLSDGATIVKTLQIYRTLGLVRLAK